MRWLPLVLHAFWQWLNSPTQSPSRASSDPHVSEVIRWLWSR